MSIAFAWFAASMIFALACGHMIHAADIAEGNIPQPAPRPDQDQREPGEGWGGDISHTVSITPGSGQRS